MWYFNYKKLLYTYNAQIPGVKLKFDYPVTGLKLLSAYTQIVSDFLIILNQFNIITTNLTNIN